MKADVCYTYLEKVLNAGVFSHYKLHYHVKLSDGWFPTGLRVEKVEPNQVDPQPSLNQVGPGLYELIGWVDRKNKNRVVISLDIRRTPVANPPKTTGAIEIKAMQGGSNVKKRDKWDQICVRIEIDHRPFLHHTGSSTQHLGDGD